MKKHEQASRSPVKPELSARTGGDYLGLAAGSRAVHARYLLGVRHIQALVVRLVLQQAASSVPVSPLHRSPAGQLRADTVKPPSETTVYSSISHLAADS